MITNKGETIKKINAKGMRKDVTPFEVGDTIKLKFKVQEGEKTRLHPFEGTVISKNGRGLAATFTVRKISFGEGVERIFPINSPLIDSLNVVVQGDVKRSKLYYLRGRTGKATRIKKKVVNA